MSFDASSSNSSSANKQTNILCILDGFGLSPNSINNAAARAKMPIFKSLLQKYPWETLNADGEAVGQEAGLVGNSEVGHMNIGGLKLVPQLSFQITKSAEEAFSVNSQLFPDQIFDPKQVLPSFFTQSQTIHLFGLFSAGSIHSDLRHWVGSIEAAGRAGAQKIVLHLITDGRDSDRQSLVQTWSDFIQQYQLRLKPFEKNIVLGSVAGRFYAMDRDKNWDRVATGTNVLFEAKNGNLVQNHLQKTYQFEAKPDFYNTLSFQPNQSESSLNDIQQEIQAVAEYNYQQEMYDEYIDPYSTKLHAINQNDTLWLINFRTDRMKQFAQMICDIKKEAVLRLNILAMNDYGDGNALAINNEKLPQNVTGYYPIFQPKPVENTLAQHISWLGKTQLHISETEKYNHVTYFLNGGQDKKWENEEWIVIPSNKVNSHAEKPEMKAKEVTDTILESLQQNRFDYIIVNYANPDMVGHTGDIDAAMSSMEFLDQQLGRLVEMCEKNGHKMVIIADHGNIEKVGEYEENGKHLIDTEHNASPVPCIFVDPHFNKDLFIQKLEEIEQNLNLQLDIKSISQAFDVNTAYDFSDQKWLNKEQINAKIQLPLWNAGVFLLAL